MAEQTKALLESESLEVLRSAHVPADAWDLRAIPDHLHLRLSVRDEHGRELAGGRDIGEIKARLAGRLKRAHAGAAKARFEVSVREVPVTAETVKFSLPRALSA